MYWEVRSEKNCIKVDVASMEIDYENLTAPKAGLWY
jgi:hypothetical protein